MISTAITESIVVHTGSDIVTLPQITEAMQAWYDHARFDPELPILWDLRLVDMSLSETQAPELDLKDWSARNLAIINARRAGRKTAWVFGDAALAEFAVDLLGGSDWQHRVRIFINDMEVAKAWLTSTIR